MACFAACFGFSKGVPVIDEVAGQLNPLEAQGWNSSAATCRARSSCGGEVRASIAPAWGATSAFQRSTIVMAPMEYESDKFDPVMSACVPLRTGSSTALSTTTKNAEPSASAAPEPPCASSSISRNLLRPSAPKHARWSAQGQPVLPRPYASASAPLFKIEAPFEEAWVPAPKQLQQHAAIAPLLLVDNDAPTSHNELGEFCESMLLSMQIRLKVDAELSTFRHLPSASSNRFVARLSMGQNTTALFSAAASATPSGAWQASGAAPQTHSNGPQPADRRYVNSLDWSAPPSSLHMSPSQAASTAAGGAAAPPLLKVAAAMAAGAGGGGDGGVPPLPLTADCPPLVAAATPVHPPYPIHPFLPPHLQHLLPAAARHSNAAPRRSNSMNRAASGRGVKPRTGGPRVLQATELTHGPLGSLAGGTSTLPSSAEGPSVGNGAAASDLGSGPGGGQNTPAQLVSDERTGGTGGVVAGLWQEQDLAQLPLEPAVDVATGATYLSPIVTPPPRGGGGSAAAANGAATAERVAVSADVSYGEGSGGRPLINLLFPEHQQHPYPHSHHNHNQHINHHHHHQHHHHHSRQPYASAHPPSGASGGRILRPIPEADTASRLDLHKEGLGPAAAAAAAAAVVTRPPTSSTAAGAAPTFTPGLTTGRNPASSTQPPDRQTTHPTPPASPLPPPPPPPPPALLSPPWSLVDRSPSQGQVLILNPHHQQLLVQHDQQPAHQQAQQQHQAREQQPQPQPQRSGTQRKGTQRHPGGSSAAGSSNLTPSPRSASWYGGAPAVHPDPTRVVPEVPVEMRLCRVAAELLEGLSEIRPLSTEGLAPEQLDGNGAATPQQQPPPPPLRVAARAGGGSAAGNPNAVKAGWLPESSALAPPVAGVGGDGGGGGGSRCRSVVLQGRWQGQPVAVKLVVGNQLEHRNGALLSVLGAATAVHSGLVRVYGIRLLPATSVGAVECRGLFKAAAATGEAVAAAVAALGLQPGEGVLVVIMELCVMGSLGPLTLAAYSPFRPNRCWPAYMARRALLCTALEVAGALAHLHRFGLTHGALRPNNVLLVPALQDKRKFCVKVADVSLSCRVLQHCAAANQLFIWGCSSAAGSHHSGGEPSIPGPRIAAAAAFPLAQPPSPVGSTAQLQLQLSRHPHPPQPAPSPPPLRPRLPPCRCSTSTPRTSSSWLRRRSLRVSRGG